MSDNSFLQECHLDICSFSNVFAFGFVGSICFFASEALAFKHLEVEVTTMKVAFFREALAEAWRIGFGMRRGTITESGLSLSEFLRSVD